MTPRAASIPHSRPPHDDAGRLSPAAKMQRKHQSAPVIKIVHFDAPKHVQIDVANFRTLVQKMTGNFIVSNSAGLEEAGLISQGVREEAPSHHHNVASQRDSRQRRVTSQVPLRLHHAQRRQPRAGKCVTSLAAAPAIVLSKTEMRPSESGVKTIMRETDKRDDGSPADCAEGDPCECRELHDVCGSMQTWACESAYERPAFVVGGSAAADFDCLKSFFTAEAGGARQTDESLDCFFADGNGGDDDGHLQLQQGTACHHAFSNVSCASGAAWNNRCSWRSSCEIPAGFDYFSVQYHPPFL